jgi:hypothetical protein
MLEGLTSEILSAVVSEFQSQTAADSDQSVAEILRLMAESGFVDLLQSTTEIVMESPQHTRRLLIRAFYLQFFQFGFNAARAIEEVERLKLLVKPD